MIETSYIIERINRLQKEARGELRIWGVMFGVVMGLISSFQYYLVVHSLAWQDTLWRIAMWTSLGLIILGFFFPEKVRPVQTPLKKIGNFVGSLLLKTIIFFFYIVIVTPIGWILQKTGKFETRHGWEPKPAMAKQKRYPFLAFPFYIIYFMIENKAYCLIPLIIVLLFTAMLLFFVQTPVIAPFVYTVF